MQFFFWRGEMPFLQGVFAIFVVQRGGKSW
jgi:hypothetical protein